MNNKERYLKFIKDFNSIGTANICKELNKDKSSFYTSRLSLENMQLITSSIRKHIKELYPLIDDNEFILNTKEDNINFTKDIKKINVTDICNNFNIQKTTLYRKVASESKYELVINEIKKELDEVYQKYNN